MSLRYRLFIWISALFLLAGIVTYTLEIFVTAKEMKRTRQQLKQKIIDLNEKKRENIEAYLTTTIGQEEAKVDILLERLSSFPLQASAFAPTSENADQGTWLVSSKVLHNNNWLDFIQNTNQGTLASLIIPRSTKLDHSFRVEISDDLAWILMGDLSKHPEPYLGVRLRFDIEFSNADLNPKEVIETPGRYPRAYLLFSWRDLLAPDAANLKSPLFTGAIPPIHANLNVPWTDGSMIDIPAFFKAFQEGRDYLQKSLATASEQQIDQVKGWIEKQFSQRGQDLNVVTIPKSLYKTLPSPFLQRELDDIVMRYDQVYMIWALAVMNDIHIFPGDLFAPSSPRGIAVHFGENQYGEGIHTRDVFFSQKAFDDAAFFQKNSPPDISANLGSKIALFQAFDLPHVFFGNTVRIEVKNGDEVKEGYLTLGMDTITILRKLVLAIHETACLVFSGKVVGGFSEDGQELVLSSSDELPMSSMLAAKSGIVKWKGEDYYYIRMNPFPYLDLHFFLLNPASKEFALLDSLNQSADEIVKHLLMNIHFVAISVLVLAILILHYLSLRITQPISKLATATQEIGEGHLEEAEIPIPSEKDTDEVASLCRSFDHMVKGLKEKEKVKAVLNKVVSQEIAQEILKGNIRLGGEEKKVSILFADIRNFTQMTRSMSPKEVIDLLNDCMTKISYLVDKHGGVIDKYVGDEAMALFGAPVESEDSAHRAIVSALGMVDALKKWNDQRKTEGLSPVEMGIGIHTGLVLAGNMGAENRLNYTVLGSNVNLAARLCSAAKGMEILISESTLNEPHVRNKILYEEVPPMLFKGFEVPVVVYRVQGLK
jgi:class 3 adenylate cyclase